MKMRLDEDLWPPHVCASCIQACTHIQRNSQPTTDAQMRTYTKRERWVVQH